MGASGFGGAAARTAAMFSWRRISFVLFALVLLALFVLFHFQQKQEKRDHLTQHNLRHLGTITQRIQERLSAFETAVRNAVTADRTKAPDAAALSRNFNFLVRVEPVPRGAFPDFSPSLEGGRAGFHVAMRGNSEVDYRISSALADVLDIDAITEDAYDALFITDAKGESVMFNSGDGQLDVTRFDSIAVEKGPRLFETAAIRTAAGRLALAGRMYECYVQPMQQRRVVAILAADRFEEKAQALPGNQIVLALIVLALLLFAAPLVSLQFAGFTDRIKPLDMFLTIVGFAAGFALLTLLLSSLVYLKYDSDLREDARLVSLSGTIRERVEREFREVDAMLAGLSELKLPDEGVTSRRRMFEKDGMATRDDVLFAAYPFFEQIYWVDTKGMLRDRWTTLDQPQKEIAIADREYYRKIMEGHEHWIQPHYSRGNSRFMVAYSKRAAFRLSESAGDTSALVAVDFLPRSLVNAALPHGLGFAVIGHDGTVLFHSVVQRSLHENLYAECTERALPDMVAAGASGHVSTRYWDEDVRMYLHPMQVHDHRWYLVTYAAQGLHADRKAGTLVMSMVLYLLFFLPVIVGYTVFLFLRDRRLAWMWFQSHRAREYATLTAMLLGASVLCVTLSLAMDNLPAAMLIGCMVPHAGLLIAFYRLDSYAWPDWRFSYLGHSRLGLRTQRRIVAFVHVAALVLYVAVIVGNTRAFPRASTDSPLGSFTAIFLVALVLTAIAAAFLRLTRLRRRRITAQRELLARHARLARRHGTGMRDTAGRRWYVAFLSSLTLILGIVPMFLFFRVSHDLHAIAYTHVEQTALQAAIERFDGALRTPYRDRFILPAARRGPLDSMHLQDWRGLYLDAENGSRLSGTPSAERHSIFSDLLLRVLMLPLTQGASSLRVHLRGNEFQPPMPMGGETMYYHREPDFLAALPDALTAVPRLLLAALLLLLLWQAVQFGARRLFLSDATRPGWSSDTEPEGNCIFIWTTREEQRAFRGRFAEVFEMARPEASTEEWVDASVEALCARDDGGQRIVLDHFDYRAEDHEYTLRKLELLERLLVTHGRQVCLICSVDPEYYLLDAGHVAPPVEIQERWKRVLNLMRRIHPPAPRSVPKDALAAAHGDGLIGIVDEECAHEGMQAMALRARALIRNGEITTREELFSWIGEACRPFHQALWMTCTKREQLVLYHLAQDGFVSHRTREVVEQLMQRGLVAMDPALRVFNESFRQFILTARTYEQIRRWENEEPPSAWARVKHPMLGFVVVIAAVLLYTNPHYFDSTIAVLTALAAVIPLVMRLRGFVSGEKTGPQ